MVACWTMTARLSVERVPGSQEREPRVLVGVERDTREMGEVGQTGGSGSCRNCDS